MCGIIGYVGTRIAQPILLQGLERLEYRGYDSAGLALVENGKLAEIRAVGNLSELKDAAANSKSLATTGVGHTRWATHGRVCAENAHPLTGCLQGDIDLVLNGIVENYRELKASLVEEGHTFSSETDAEVISHLVERHYKGDLVSAVRAAYAELEGHFAFVVLHREHPKLIVGARHQCPLLVGVGTGEMFLASTAAAFLGDTKRVQIIEDDEIVAVRPEGATFWTVDGEEVFRTVDQVNWDIEAAEKGGFETFMLKEIYEQPDAIEETIGDRIRHGRLELDGLGLDDDEIRNLRRIVIVACGTAYHSGVVARYAIEEWARIPVEHDIASEWRYRNPVLSRDTLVIGITQSGETADTLAAMRLARESRARTLAVTNMMGTQITREVDSVLYTRAGLEMSVAATKTFTSQVSLFYLLALKLAQVRKTLPEEEIAALLEEVHELPAKMAFFLAGDHPIDEVAQRHYDKPFFLFLGRNVGLPVCLEGALKLKELSYIPTEAYSAGEMKHGPIALLDDSTPVVCVATDGPILEKMLSNVEEVRARGAQTIGIATAGSKRVAEVADETIEVAATDWILQPIVAILPLQLLAYDIARKRGLNVDQPRNLAKTVTVE